MLGMSRRREWAVMRWLRWVVRWLVIAYPDLTRGSPRARKQDKVGTSMLQRGSRGGRLLGEVGSTLP